MLSSSEIKKLKLMIKNAQKKYPKSPRYSSKIKEMIGRLTQYLTIDQIYKDFGVSKYYISRTKKNYKKSNSKSRSKNIKDNLNLESTPLQFVELPNEKNTSQPFMKLTSPNGLIIEIWG